MIQEDKELLLKDLCARLPYGVIVTNSFIQGEFLSIEINIPKAEEIVYFKILSNSITADTISNIKPYLRPMSSITEEEKHKLLKFGAVTRLENGQVVDVSCVGFERHADIQDYLNACHFDYRGLIEKGLALEAPEGMYK